MTGHMYIILLRILIFGTMSDVLDAFSLWIQDYTFPIYQGTLQNKTLYWIIEYQHRTYAYYNIVIYDLIKEQGYF